MVRGLFAKLMVFGDLGIRVVRSMNFEMGKWLIMVEIEMHFKGSGINKDFIW